MILRDLTCTLIAPLRALREYYTAAA